ncbi:signal transduction histidine kinase [Microbacterium halimionae]|uniref:histidine kinase n=1 Tax=Microbacterium halimionae TaxID=1526413 RepID=A0A7W3JNR6_9MICO|nr:HAMP domain-containing sensor histidine kinase [Microbacterium halimionae]MBA8816248.1 signal transduction histidine kinase [Microbacterium halimionae]NII96450.1 signal transduction histidine kinase [Microbacterium halimionae]
MKRAEGNVASGETSRGTWALAHIGRQPGTYADADRARSALLNQVPLCAVVLVILVLEFAVGATTDPGFFLLGVLLIFASAGATLIVPWNRGSALLIAVIPIIDIFAIAILRSASPAGGYGLLWVFPAMWLGSLGLATMITSLVVIPPLYWVLLVLSNAAFGLFSAFVLPAVIAAVSFASFTAARRSGAQRVLTVSRSEVLAGALARAQRHEQLVTDVLDSVDFGVVRFTAGGDTAFMNDAYCRLVDMIPGFADPNITAANLYASDGTTEVSATASSIARALRGEVFDRDVLWHGAPNERRWAVSSTARKIRDERGVDAGTVVIVQDVTAALTAQRARDELVASISHELRTPLTSLMGHLDLALDDADLSTRARENLTVAARSGDRLGEIVAEVLTASRTSRLSLDMNMSPEDLDVARLLLRTAEEWRAAADERAITINTDGVHSARVCGDPVRLRQVFDNLISNAIQFNRDGGLVTVVSHEDSELGTTVTVHDTGSGVPLAAQERLFDRFFRGQSRTTGGTGLGLSISRDIVRAHSGDISFSTDLGSGSSFTVHLPPRAASLSGLRHSESEITS